MIEKKIRAWVKLVKTGRMTEQKFYEKYNAWKTTHYAEIA